MPDPGPDDGTGRRSAPTSTGPGSVSGEGEFQEVDESTQSPQD